MDRNYEIHPKLKLPQNLSYHHFKVLKHLKLLKSKKDGNKIIYERDEGIIKKYQSELTKTILKDYDYRNNRFRV